MIDFQNAKYIKLKPVSDGDFLQIISPMMIAGEEIVQAFKGMRDGVVFTNKRVFAINVQGVTGKKKDFTSIPYSKITTYSLETAGTFDLDAELELYLSGVGKVKFEFTGSTDVKVICKLISEYTLR